MSFLQIIKMLFAFTLGNTLISRESWDCVLTACFCFINLETHISQTYMEQLQMRKIANIVLYKKGREEGLVYKRGGTGTSLVL